MNGIEIRQLILSEDLQSSFRMVEPRKQKLKSRKSVVRWTVTERYCPRKGALLASACFSAEITPFGDQSGLDNRAVP